MYFTGLSLTDYVCLILSKGWGRECWEVNLRFCRRMVLSSVISYLYYFDSWAVLCCRYFRVISMPAAQEGFLPLLLNEETLPKRGVLPRVKFVTWQPWVGPWNLQWGSSPVEQYLQYLQKLGWPWDIPEELWWGSSDGGVPETRGPEPDQWLAAMSVY